jgi:hypothetical protein
MVCQLERVDRPSFIFHGIIEHTENIFTPHLQIRNTKMEKMNSRQPLEGYSKAGQYGVLMHLSGIGIKNSTPYHLLEASLFADASNTANCNVIVQSKATADADWVTTTTVADAITPGGKYLLSTNFVGVEVRILFVSTGAAKMSGTYFTSYEAANAYIDRSDSGLSCGTACEVTDET